MRAILATRNFSVAQLYTFTLSDGTVLRYTDADIDLTLSGNTYSCGGQTGPFFGADNKTGNNKVRAHWKLGTDVDTLVFDVFPKNGTIEGIPFLQACVAGFFDNADCVVDRVYMPHGSYGDTSAGKLNIFTGRVGDVDASRSMATFTVNGLTVLLRQMLPRNVYQPSCLNTLYDSACTLSRSSFSSAAKVSSGCTVSTILSTGLTSVSNRFTLGSLKFTGGQNSGFQRGVKQYTHSTGSSASTVTLMSPFPFAAASSDPFTIYAGCNKILNDANNGCASFNNTPNFRGMPYLPQPVTAI